MLVRHIALVGDKLTHADAATVNSQVATVAAALQVQAARDFAPLWKVDATVSGFMRLEDVPLGHWPIIVKEKIGSNDELGFHLDKHNQPYALVKFAPDWTLTVSHELLEMLADPFGNRLVPGPSLDNAHPNNRVSYLVEVCDPCEDSDFAYSINGVVVSDFITPHFHDPDRTTGARYSFTGAVKKPREILKNGYISWEDPTLGRWFQLQNFGVPEVTDLGPIENKRSLREHLNTVTPTPADYYRADSEAVHHAGGKREGAQRASEAKAKALRECFGK
jgi:hypothetical protein